MSYRRSFGIIATICSIAFIAAMTLAAPASGTPAPGSEFMMTQMLEPQSPVASIKDLKLPAGVSRSMLSPAVKQATPLKTSFVNRAFPVQEVRPHRAARNV